MSAMTALDQRRQRIRALNDALRRTFRGGKVVQTPGVAGLPFAEQRRILDQVRRFDAFTADNDPHGEHDMGVIESNGRTVFWKIDYYDPTETWLGEDPADPEKTCRVLTILLAEEY